MGAHEGSEQTRAREPRVLILNQYAAPDTTASARYVSTVAWALADAGMHVTVLAGEPSYGESALSAAGDELRDGVRIRRVRMGAVRGRRSKLKRFGGYLRYLAGASLIGRRLVRGEAPDVVVCFSNPPFVPLVARWLARKANARFIYIIHDIHPDILLATDWLSLPTPIIRGWDLLNGVMLRAASNIVVLGEGMRELMIEEKGVAGERVSVIPLWGEPELEPSARDEDLRAELGIRADELMVLSAGNLGIMHSLEPLVDAAFRLEGQAVRFVVVATGARAEYWRARCDGLSNVLFLPFGSEERFRRLVAACDVALVPLSPGMERLAVPSRAYTLLSAGRPLLTVMDPRADVAQLVLARKCGFNATDGGSLADGIEISLGDRAGLQQAGKRARAIYEERYARDVVLGRYVSLCLQAEPEAVATSLACAVGSAGSQAVI